MRGEVVVVVAGDPDAQRAPLDEDVIEALQGILGAGATLRDAAQRWRSNWASRVGAPTTWPWGCGGTPSGDVA